MPVVNLTLGMQKVAAMAHHTNRSTSVVKQSLQSLVQGANRCKYFNQPLKTNLQPGNTVSILIEDSDSSDDYSDDEIPYQKYVAVQTQTDFRESESQTEPWDPPYKECSIYAEPEILSIKKLCYGSGLPASLLEVEHITKVRANKKSEAALSISDDEDKVFKKRQVILDQVKAEWDYKISKLNQKQAEKIELMEFALTAELMKNSERSERLLKNIWTRKNTETAQKKLKWQHKLNKQIHDLEISQTPAERKKKSKSMIKEKKPSSFSKYNVQEKQKLADQVNTLFSSYYMSNIDGLSEIERWMNEEQNMTLENELFMPKQSALNTHMQKLTDKAYQDLLVNKRTKLPPKIYHEDYDREDVPQPPVEQVGFEKLELAVERIDPVTVVQKTLRGRSFQKEVLEVIDRHKDGLMILLSHKTSARHDPVSENIETTVVEDNNNKD